MSTSFPMMDEIIRQSGNDQVKDIVIGMAHRGRLNVLVNTLGKNPRKLFAATPAARRRRYDPGQFSFNVAKGRCATCEGEVWAATHDVGLPVSLGLWRPRIVLPMDFDTR